MHRILDHLIAAWPVGARNSAGLLTRNYAKSPRVLKAVPDRLRVALKAKFEGLRESAKGPLNPYDRISALHPEEPLD